MQLQKNSLAFCCVPPRSTFETTYLLRRIGSSLQLLPTAFRTFFTSKADSLSLLKANPQYLSFPAERSSIQFYLIWIVSHFQLIFVQILSNLLIYPFFNPSFSPFQTQISKTAFFRHFSSNQLDFPAIFSSSKSFPNFLKIASKAFRASHEAPPSIPADDPAKSQFSPK